MIKPTKLEGVCVFELQKDNYSTKAYQEAKDDLFAQLFELIVKQNERVTIKVDTFYKQNESLLWNTITLLDSFFTFWACYSYERNELGNYLVARLSKGQMKLSKKEKYVDSVDFKRMYVPAKWY